MMAALGLMPQEHQYSALALDLSLANSNIPPERFEAFLNACIVWEYPWGAIFAYGNDMHIHVMTTHRKKVLFRKELKQVADIMFSHYNHLKTSILKTKPWALDFDLRIGWKLKAEDNERWYLIMTREDFYNVWN